MNDVNQKLAADSFSAAIASVIYHFPAAYPASLLMNASNVGN